MSADRAPTAATDRATPSTARVLVFFAGWIVASILAAATTVLVLRSVAPATSADPDTISVLVVPEVYLLIVAVAALVFRRELAYVAGLRPTQAQP